jgi:class 3 adenylate cyclase/tetratricopeptide (TPR) repeat protein
VTILFCDLKGSTALGEALDPESLREVMGRYFEAMQTAIAKHGGTIEKYIGDAVMVVFGLPRVHEDDALRAVRAAQAMQEALHELNVELERTYGVTLANRIGVNTGEVVAGDASLQQRLVTGDAVNVAARLEQAAGDSETLLGELTYKLVSAVVEVEPVEPLTLKGKAEPMPAFRLVHVKDAFANEPLAITQDLVGRAADLDVLVGTLAEVVSTGRPRMLTVLGEVGVGKTRLLDEFAAQARQDCFVLRGRCLSYGDGITFWPIAEALRLASGIADGDDGDAVVQKVGRLVGVGHEDVVDRLVSLMGLGAAAYPLPELFWSVRRLLELLGARRPVLFVVEDLHWAEPTLHELLESLEDVEAPALMVAAARPDVVERRPSIADGPTLTLERLDRGATGAMVEALLGGPVAGEALEEILRAADGNPLFAQQLVAMLHEEGALRLIDGAWTLADLGERKVPPTIYALLSARIDNLGPRERAVLDPASVIGQIFPLQAVSELSTLDDGIAGHVERLTALRYLTMPQEHDPEEFRQFHHGFIRDSVYDSLLKRNRATLHERFVVWADRVNGDRASEFDEILGYHLEQASRLLLELAPSDPHATELGADGARRLHAAGRRAFVRGDMPAAANLLRRALALLPAAHGHRFVIAPDLAEALMQIGDFAGASETVETTVAAASAAGTPERASAARIVGELVGLFSGSVEAGEWTDRARATVGEVVSAAEATRDEATLARAYRLLAWAEGKACRYEAAADALGRAIDHARTAGDIRQERRASTAYALTSAHGPTPVEEALARCAAVAERVAGDRQAEAAIMCIAGHLEAMHGDFALARQLGSQSRALFEELGLRVEAASMVLESARVELLADDPAAAEEELQRGYRVLDELRERYLLSTLSGLLARAVLRQGRYDEADDLTQLAEELSDDDDVDAQVHWRCVRARVMAAAGDRSGIALVESALELLAPTDAVPLEVEALIDYGNVLASFGDPRAAEAFAKARQAAEAKGNIVLARRAELALPVAAQAT